MTKPVLAKLATSAGIVVMALTTSVAVADVPDDCTPRLEKYLDTLRQNVASEHISPRQKEASQKLIDKAGRLRANTEYTYTDCAVFDKLLF